jgi:hypothetical protein
VASSLWLSVLWIATAIASILATQAGSFPLLQRFVQLSMDGLLVASAVAIAFAAYLAFRHSWRAMSALLSLSGFLGATACLLRFAAV